LESLLSLTDGVVVDLKAFSQKNHKILTIDADIQKVLECLRAAHRKGCFVEVVNLLVPGYNDSADEIRSLCRFVKDELSRDIPVHFSRAFPKHRLEHIAPTPSATINMAIRSARQIGLRYVYSNNVKDLNNHTYCPNCNRLIIQRNFTRIQKTNFSNGKCSSCEQEIAGLWEA